jgi:hypothetical protein
LGVHGAWIVGAAVRPLPAFAKSKGKLGYSLRLGRPKKPDLDATWARVRNTDGATFALNESVTGPNQASTGIDLGVRHSF